MSKQTSTATCLKKLRLEEEEVRNIKKVSKEVASREANVKIVVLPSRRSPQQQASSASPPAYQLKHKLKLGNVTDNG